MKVLPGTSLVALIVRDNIIYFFMYVFFSSFSFFSTGRMYSCHIYRCYRIVAAMIVNVICFVFTDLNPGISVITFVSLFLSPWKYSLHNVQYCAFSRLDRRYTYRTIALAWNESAHAAFDDRSCAYAFQLRRWILGPSVSAREDK